ncbi:MAG: zinc dependent phospholipase C family protein [Clostridia bacterium]|nr:zinc dependent phospholipase C family protein [Clostridia bacterium]
MAGWITHMRIADEVLKQLPELDKVGFCLGSIAPDCNVENENWTAFTPPREVTHWMSGKSKYKTFEDCDRFLAERICGRTFADNQERSFYLGYFAHLIADVMWTLFAQDEERVHAMWQRIRTVPVLSEKAESLPETFEAAKLLVDKKRRIAEINAWENEYLYTHPETAYLTVLQTVRAFPDYLDYLPKGAIIRKIGVMGGVPERIAECPEQVFFTFEEMDACTAEICAEVIKRIKRI